MDLSRLLRPKNLAVLGGIWADTVVQQARRLGFDGPIWRVHPKRGDFRGLSDLPAAPDAVFLGVNADTTLDLVQEARALNAGGVVGFASGFAESGAANRDTALRTAAGEMPVLGPNCYGIINFFDGVSLFPDQVRCERPQRGVALIAQSGTVALNMMYAERSLPVGYLIAAGNATLVTIPMLVEAMVADPRVSAIGLYLEGIPDLQAFAQAAQTAWAAGKRIVLFKSGRSEAAKRTAQSHTGALGGEERYYDALFARLGIARVETLSELLETLKVAHGFGTLPSNDIAVCAPSGGDVAMAADVIDGLPLRLPPLPNELHARLRAVLGDAITLANPLDFQTHTWHDTEALNAFFTTFLSGPGSAKVLQLDLPNPAHFDASSFEGPLRVYFKAAKAAHTHAAVLSSIPENLPETMRLEAWQAGVVPLQGMGEAYRALSHAASKASSAPYLSPSLGTPVILTEAEGKAVLAEAGIKVPNGVVCDARDVKPAAHVPFPAVVKACSNELVHKSDHGGVQLGITSEAALGSAALSMARLANDVLIEEMVDGGLAELIIGVDQDRDFGPVVLIGAGGVLTEVLQDTRVLLPNFTRQAVKDALLSLRIAPLFTGYRGKPPADLDAAIDVVMAVQDLAPRVGTLDINPLLLREKDAIALDCYMTLLEDTP